MNKLKSLVVCAVIVLSGCSNRTHEELIVGSWLCEIESETIGSAKITTHFLKDGTNASYGVFKLNDGTTYSLLTRGVWKIKNDSILEEVTYSDHIDIPPGTRSESKIVFLDVSEMVLELNQQLCYCNRYKLVE